MKSASTLFAVLASLLVVVGCGGSDDQPSKPSAGPLLHFETGGGFAPRNRELIVQPDGSAELSGSDVESAKFTLSDGELKQLRGALDKTPASQIGTDGEGYCADCFTYSLEYGGEKFSGAETDVSDEGGDVIGAISTLIEAHATPIDTPTSSDD